MSQVFTDDCYASTHQAQTDLQAFEDNFAALKSSFSGANAPSNPIAGMWWLDTTAHILKQRNEANSAWLSVWDMANNKPIIANLSNEITVAMIDAAAKDAAAGTASLRTLGAGALQACAGTDARLSDARTPIDGSVTEVKLGASAVALAKLKIATGSITWAQGANFAGDFAVDRYAHAGHLYPAGGNPGTMNNFYTHPNAVKTSGEHIEWYVNVTGGSGGAWVIYWYYHTN